MGTGIPEGVRAGFVVAMNTRLEALRKEIKEIDAWLAENGVVIENGVAVDALPGNGNGDAARRTATSKRMKRYWAKRRKAKKAAEAEQVQVMVSEPLETVETEPAALALLKGAK